MPTQKETPDGCVCVFRDSRHHQLDATDLQEQCGEQQDGGLFCTRPEGHKGEHVACGNMGDHYIDSWGD